MRGKVYSFGDVKDQVGITPAYAGKRTAFATAVACLWDHPRLCGEKEMRLSSGTLCRRITPAYAGKRCQLAMFT